ncbi:hypothetical protein H4582DRAFT_1982808, partial [Lactarius indigo]
TPEYLEEAIYLARTFAEITAEQRLRPVPVVSFEEHDDDPEIDPTFEKLDLLDELLSEISNNDTTEIDGAIEKGRVILASAQRNLLTSGLFDLFGLILFEAFRRTNKIEYLNESISTHRQVFERPSIQFQRSTTLRYRTRDLDEVVKLLPQCVNDRHASLPDRFRFTCLWAYAARDNRHPSRLPFPSVRECFVIDARLPAFRTNFAATA